MNKAEYKRSISHVIAIAIIVGIVAIGLTLFGMQTATKVQAATGSSVVCYRITGTGNNLTMQLGSRNAISGGAFYYGNNNETFGSQNIKKESVTKIEIVDNICPSSVLYYFCKFNNLKKIDGLQKLDTSNATEMIKMFEGCSSLQELDVSKFNTSKVMNMLEMFSGCTSLQKLDVSKFDTSKVTNMYHMFYGCENLKKLDVSKFNTSNVTDMRWMFRNCKGIQELDVSKFNTSKVTNMQHMFYGCENLKKLDVSKFNTSNVTDMRWMFRNCKGIQELDVSKFNTSKVTNMHHMFTKCVSLQELDLSSFDTSNVMNMNGMFYYCTRLQKLDVSKFNTSNVTDMGCMFTGCESLRELNVSKYDTSKVTNMQQMFRECPSLQELDVSNFNTSKVTNMFVMFSSCNGLKELDVSKFNTSNVTNMSGMFSSCNGLKELDVSKFNTSNVTDMSGMFSSCNGLKKLDVSNFNTSNVTDMPRMFNSCNGLKELDVSNFNTSNVTDMSSMFSSCDGLKKLNLSGFDTSNVTNMRWMFCLCNNLKTIYASDSFVTDKVENAEYLFDQCNKLGGGAGTKYRRLTDCNKEYAQIDGKNNNPGLFTAWTFNGLSWIENDEDGCWEAVAYYTLYDSDVTEEVELVVEEIEDKRVEPTCEEPGLQVYKAFLEKEDSLDYVPRQFTKEVPLYPEGHDYGEWERLNDEQHQKVCENNTSHIKKERHKWNAGMVTKEATTSHAGEISYTCKVCEAIKKAVIPKLNKQPSAEKEITSMKKDADLKESVFRELQLTSRKQSRNSVKIQWKKMSGAVQYVVYGNKCGSKNKMTKLFSAKGTSTLFKTILGKRLKKGTYYKFIVAALDKNNSTVSISKMIHVATKGGKIGNHKKVVIRAKTGTRTKTIRTAKLKKGNSLRLKPKLKPANKKSKVRNHVSIRYESSNTKVAAVSKKGKIIANGKGSCTIYAFAQNGVYNTVKVSVK